MIVQFHLGIQSSPKMIINTGHSYIIPSILEGHGHEDTQINLPPDLRQFTVLRKTDWMKIQDDLRGVNKEQQRLREAAKHREALHLQSKEVVKLWSNTITVRSLLKSCWVSRAGTET